MLAGILLLLRWRRRRRCLLCGVSSILRLWVLIILVILIVVAIGRRLLVLAALVVRHFVVIVGAVERDRVAGRLRELLDAPKGSIASRLIICSARGPHGEVAFYSRPRIGCRASHTMDGMAHFEVVAVHDAADGARRSERGSRDPREVDPSCLARWWCSRKLRMVDVVGRCVMGSTAP